MNEPTEPETPPPTLAGEPRPDSPEGEGADLRASAPLSGAGSTVGEGVSGQISREASERGGTNTPAEGEGEAATTGPGYREKQSVYADRYGANIRTVKLWIKEGREYQSPEHPHGFPPPLDDPEAMLGWWHEVKTNRVPARLLIAAETAQKARATVGDGVSGKPAREASEAEGNISTPGQTPPPAPRQSTTAATGFAASLDRVRIAEAEAHGRYLEALAEPDEAKRNDARIERLRKAWSELSDQLRFLEKAAPEVLAKSGEIITKADARRILGELHGPIVAGVRSLFRRVRAKAQTPNYVRSVERLVAAAREGTAPNLVDLEGLLVATKNSVGEALDELEKIHAAEVERVLADLHASEFAPRIGK